MSAFENTGFRLDLIHSARFVDGFSNLKMRSLRLGRIFRGYDSETPDISIPYRIIDVDIFTSSKEIDSVERRNFWDEIEMRSERLADNRESCVKKL